MSATGRVGGRGHFRRAGGGRPLVSPRPARLEPSPEEVVAAVVSLYEDELKPFGRILLKRLRERSSAAAEGGDETFEALMFGDVDDVAHIDPKYLRRVCEGCPALIVEPADGREYAVLLNGAPARFVDVCSPHDPYPASLWAEVSAYFGSVSEEEGSLPGGRYACAQVLMARNLPFLHARSLGEACHIVQLAVSQKKILGYLQGHMVPYGNSEEFVKERCAAWKQPVGAADRGGAPSSLRIASWKDARLCLREILESTCNPSPGTITMSNVKRLFRSRYDLELSETALGYSRLCELLQDPRLRDVCRVQSLGNGQVVVCRAGPRHAPRDAAPEPGRRALRRGAALRATPHSDFRGGDAAPPQFDRSSTCASLRSLPMPLDAVCQPYNTTMPCAYIPDGPMHESPALASELKWDGGDSRNWAEYVCANPEYYCGVGQLDWSMHHEDWGTCVQWGSGSDAATTYPEDGSTVSSSPASSCGTFPSPLANVFTSTEALPGPPFFRHAPESATTGSPATSESSGPRSLMHLRVSQGMFDWPASSDVETCSFASASDDVPSALMDVGFVQQPMHAMKAAAMEDHIAGGPFAVPPATSNPTENPSAAFQGGSPGLTVRNTFIHIAPSGVQEAGTKRSQSVPRCLRPMTPGAQSLPHTWLSAH